METPREINVKVVFTDMKDITFTCYSARVIEGILALYNSMGEMIVGIPINNICFWRLFYN